MEEKNIEVSLSLLQEVSDTLKIVSDTLGSKKRETCMDRIIMRTWNYVDDAMNGHISLGIEGFKYYTQCGQEPDIYASMIEEDEGKETANNKLNNHYHGHVVRALPCGSNDDITKEKKYLLGYDTEIINEKLCLLHIIWILSR